MGEIDRGGVGGLVEPLGCRGDEEGDGERHSGPGYTYADTESVRVCIHLKPYIMLYKHRVLAFHAVQGGDEGSETEGWCDMPLETVGTHVAPRA